MNGPVVFFLAVAAAAAAATVRWDRYWRAAGGTGDRSPGGAGRWLADSAASVSSAKRDSPSGKGDSVPVRSDLAETSKNSSRVSGDGS